MYAKKFSHDIRLPIFLVVFAFSMLAFLKSDLFCKQAHAACMSNHAPQTSSTEKITDHYFMYSPERFSNSLKEGKTVVLYFHAAWCSTCSSFDQELRANPTLPQELVVLQIPYDTATDLKIQYNVTHQHTLVLLDQSGKTREMWIGGDLQSLLEFLW
jgi:thiol:disulfide interchange protein